MCGMLSYNVIHPIKLITDKKNGCILAPVQPFINMWHYCIIAATNNIPNMQATTASVCKNINTFSFIRFLFIGSSSAPLVTYYYLRPFFFGVCTGIVTPISANSAKSAAFRASTA